LLFWHLCVVRSDGGTNVHISMVSQISFLQQLILYLYFCAYEGECCVERDYKVCSFLRCRHHGNISSSLIIFGVMMTGEFVGFPP